MMDPETPVGQIVWACGSTGATANPHEVNVELCLACFNAAMDAAKCEAEGRAAIAQGNLDQLRMTRDEKIARLRAEVERLKREEYLNHNAIRVGTEGLRDMTARAESAEAEVARLKVVADGCPDSQNEDACGDCVNCARVGMRAALDGRAEALATVAALQAKVEELRRWKETHSVTATIRVRAESAEAENAKLRVEGDELRAIYGQFVDDIRAAVHGPELGFGRSQDQYIADASRLRSRAESAESDRDVAEARVAELEAAAWELFQAFDGTDVALQARMLDNLRALLAPREPKSCGECGGSGYVWDGPAGVHISDGNAMKPCPECRGGEETK